MFIGLVEPDWFQFQPMLYLNYKFCQILPIYVGTLRLGGRVTFDTPSFLITIAKSTLLSQKYALLLAEQLVDLDHQASELLLVIESGELDNAALAVDEDVASDTRLLQRVAYIDASVRIKA